MVPAPWKLRLSSGISPVRISQIASKSMPRFLVSLIAIRRASLELSWVESVGEPGAEMQPPKASVNNALLGILFNCVANTYLPA